MAYMTRETGRRVVQLVIAGMVCMLFVVGYVFWSAYSGRVQTVKGQRAGCERAKLDRNSNGEGWRIASEARRRDGQYVVAQKYADIALGLENRGAIACANAFPKARLIP